MSNLRPRFNDHNLVNDIIRSDWIDAIKLDPNSFDGLLYLPEAKAIAPEDDIYPTSEATVLDENQKVLDYALPIVVPVLENPDVGDGFYVDESGEDGHGDQGSVLTVKIGHDPVPIGSIIEWEEALHDNNVRRVWWYVQSSRSFGTTKAGVLYYLIPCRSLDLPEE